MGIPLDGGLYQGIARGELDMEGKILAGGVERKPGLDVGKGEFEGVVAADVSHQFTLGISSVNNFFFATLDHELLPAIGLFCHLDLISAADIIREVAGEFHPGMGDLREIGQIGVDSKGEDINGGKGNRKNHGHPHHYEELDKGETTAAIPPHGFDSF
jgi:hypothetical protein